MIRTPCPNFTLYIITMWLGFLSIIIVSLIFLTRSAFSEDIKYLYNVNGNGDESFPIIDYMQPDSAILAEEASNYEYMHPDFLYKPENSPDYNPPPRVVEFYAPW